MPRAETTKWRWEEIGFRIQIKDILIEQIVTHIEERGKRIAVAKELCECGPRIAMELICKCIIAVATIASTCMENKLASYFKYICMYLS